MTAATAPGHVGGPRPGHGDATSWAAVVPVGARRTAHMIGNAHIDPVWLWPFEEGLAATLATFRSAAALCEEFDDFVFCHNEALLYLWVEEHEAALPPLERG